MVDELLLNSFIWPAAIAMSMHLPHTRVENDAVMLASQKKAVKSVREHIHRNDVSDSVIFAVLALIIRDTDPSLAMQEELDHVTGGFDAPLRSMGWLQYLSRLRWTDSHIHALKRLVAARGGLLNITTPGIAEQVQSSDILHASVSLTIPNFTMCRLYEHVLQNKMKVIRPPRKRIEDIFPAVTDIEFQDLLLDMRMYCRHLAKLVDRDDADDLQSLSDTSVPWETNVTRNIIQYRLLRLPRYTRNDEEICRLAALIFSFGVIYPVARRKPLDRLLTYLTAAFQCHKNFPFFKKQRTTTSPSEKTEPTASPEEYPTSPTQREKTRQVLLWVTIVSALAAKHTHHEAFFSDLAKQLLSSIEVDDFTQLKVIVSQYLWLDKACDTGAVELFGNLKNLQPGHPALSRNESALRTVKHTELKEMYSLICTDISACAIEK